VGAALLMLLSYLGAPDLRTAGCAAHRSQKEGAADALRPMSMRLPEPNNCQLELVRLSTSGRSRSDSLFHRRRLRRAADQLPHDGLLRGLNMWALGDESAAASCSSVIGSLAVNSASDGIRRWSPAMSLLMEAMIRQCSSLIRCCSALFRSCPALISCCFNTNSLSSRFCSCISSRCSSWLWIQEPRPPEPVSGAHSLARSAASAEVAAVWIWLGAAIGKEGMMRLVANSGRVWSESGEWVICVCRSGQSADSPR